VTMTKQLVMCAVLALTACGKGKDAPKPLVEPVAQSVEPVAQSVEPAAKSVEPATPTAAKLVVAATAPPVDAKVSAAFEEALACKWNDEDARFDDCEVLDSWVDVAHLDDKGEGAYAERAAYLVWRLQTGDLRSRRVAATVLDADDLGAHGLALLGALIAETDPPTAVAIAKLVGELPLAKVVDRAALVAAFRKGSPDVKAALAEPLGDASCKECLAAVADELAGGKASATNGVLLQWYSNAALDAKVCASLTAIALADKGDLGVRAHATTKLGEPACASQHEPLVAGFEAAAKAGKDSDIIQALDLDVLKSAKAPAPLRARSVAAARLYAAKAPNMTTRVAALDLIAHHDPQAKEFLAGFKSDMDDVAAHAKELAGSL
jgi:hypothetical protein